MIKDYKSLEKRVSNLEKFLTGRTSKMINILHIVNGWPSGGITEQTYLACKHLGSSEFNHYSIGYCHFDGEFAKKFEEIGTPCIHSDPEYSNLKEVIEENCIHIVHKQTGGGDCPPYVEKLKEWGIPLVETLHCPRATGIPYDSVEVIVYTTEYTKEKNDPKMFDKMVPIQYALDLTKPFPSSSKKRDKIVVGRLGRIVPDKRADVIFDVAELAYAEFGDSVEFRLAGQIPADFEAHIMYGKFFMMNVNDSPNVEYKGFVPDKYDFWRDIDICINPVWEASFDIVFLEAMACGIPIITWDNSAAKYVVGDAGLVTEENIDDLYKGLKTVIKDKKLYKQLSKNGIQKIRGEYSLDTFKSAYTDLYKKIWQKYY